MNWPQQLADNRGVEFVTAIIQRIETGLFCHLFILFLTFAFPSHNVMFIGSSRSRLDLFPRNILSYMQFQTRNVATMLLRLTEYTTQVRVHMYNLLFFSHLYKSLFFPSSSSFTSPGFHEHYSVDFSLTWKIGRDPVQFFWYYLMQDHSRFNTPRRFRKIIS